jgi:hypothetical protein
MTVGSTKLLSAGNNIVGRVYKVADGRSLGLKA